MSTIEILSDLDECERLWQSHHPENSYLNEWTLRRDLAQHYGVKPAFLVDQEYGTFLPTGTAHGKYIFFGGAIYAEHNRILGPQGGEKNIFGFLQDARTSFRLLSWSDDPIRHLRDEQKLWDVPYNQYWTFPSYKSADTFIDSFPAQRQKRLRYLQRKFRTEISSPESSEKFQMLADAFMKITAQAFETRGFHSIYADEHHRLGILRALNHFSDKGEVKLFETFSGSTPAALGVMVWAKESKQSLYLLNLYDAAINDSSAAVLLAICSFAADNALSIDGLRGAFGQKPRFGFSPSPSYALVSDPAWTARYPTDLTRDETVALYGRRFLNEPQSETRT